MLSHVLMLSHVRFRNLHNQPQAMSHLNHHRIEQAQGNPRTTRDCTKAFLRSKQPILHVVNSRTAFAEIFAPENSIQACMKEL